MVFQLCLIRMSDVDLYEAKTCRKIQDLEVWAQSLYEDVENDRYFIYFLHKRLTRLNFNFNFANYF